MAFILSGHWSARNMDCISMEGGQSRQRAIAAALLQLSLVMLSLNQRAKKEEMGTKRKHLAWLMLSFRHFETIKLELCNGC